MKTVIQRALLAAASLLLLFSGAVSARPSGIVMVKPSELDASTRALVAGHTTAVVIEFYDPRDPDASGECRRQLPVFRDVQRQYAGRVLFLRVSVLDEDPNLIARGRIAVCPTHLFVLSTDKGELVTRRIWGYLDHKQMEELMQEFYRINP